MVLNCWRGLGHSPHESYNRDSFGEMRMFSRAWDCHRRSIDARRPARGGLVMLGHK